MKAEIERFERFLKRRYSDRSTPKHYMSDVRLFARHVDKAAIEVSVHDIDSYVDQQVAEGKSPATINRRLASLHTFFEFLASEEPDQRWSNPVLWNRHKVQKEELLPRDLADAAVERLFAVIQDERDRAMFGLMISAGLRVKEVADLHLDNLEAPATPDQMARLRVMGKRRKERIVWLTPPVYATLQAWLAQRPDSSSEQLFLNQHARPITVSGIQYRFKQYCEQAQVKASCHQLRHTLARRLAEQDMPVEILAKLLGHKHTQTTQIYIAGANLDVREHYAQAMAKLEESPQAPVLPDLPELPVTPSPREQADPADLELCQAYFEAFPDWLKQPLQAYLAYRWRNWQPRLARRHGISLAATCRRHWNWLLEHYPLTGWADLRRSHLEAWQNYLKENGMLASSRGAELSKLMSLLHFVAAQDIPLEANLFRVARPHCPDPLPRYLAEPDYRRLEQTVLKQTADDSVESMRDRAIFLTLAYTGVRMCELLNLRLSDIDLPGQRLVVRGGKNSRDRVVCISPKLNLALCHYLACRPVLADDHVWIARGKPVHPSYVERCLKRWGGLCNVNVSAHRLRHTLATRLINQGMPLESIRKLLGHKHLNMAQRYARVHDSTVQEQFRAAMAKIEGIAICDWPELQTTQVEQPAESPVCN